MNRNKRMLSTLLSMSIVLGPISLNYNNVNAYDGTLSDSSMNIYLGVGDRSVAIEDSSLENIPIKDYNCSEKLNKILSEIEYYLVKYNSTSNLVDLYKTFELFGSIIINAEEEDVGLFMSDTVVDSFFKSIREFVYEIPDINISGKAVVDFAKEILFGWRKNKISSDYPEYFMVKGLVKYNEDKNKLIQKELEYLEASYSYMINTSEGNTNSEELPEIEMPNDAPASPPPEIDNGEVPVPEDSEGNNEGVFDKVDKEDSFTIDNYYKKVGNTCILVERKYKDGYVFEQKELSVPKEDYVYCGINDYIFDGVKGNVFNNSGTIIDEDYIMNNQNEDSNKFVFYTVTKDMLTPYYYNTGIKATISETLTYNQLKDVLYQVAIKAKGFSTDTNTKSLSIIEGKPTVIRDDVDIYSKKYIENLFESYKKVGLKIQKESDANQNELEKLIKNNSLITISGDNKEITMKGFYMDGISISVPVQELMGHFGYESRFDDDNNELILTGDNFKLVLKRNMVDYILNGQEGKLPTKVKVVNGEWHVDFSSIMEIMGYTLEWNREELIFQINKKKGDL